MSEKAAAEGSQVRFERVLMILSHSILLSFPCLWVAKWQAIEAIESGSGSGESARLSLLVVDNITMWVYYYYSFFIRWKHFSLERRQSHSHSDSSHNSTPQLQYSIVRSFVGFEEFLGITVNILKVNYLLLLLIESNCGTYWKWR
jgi:hypothetical protein